MINVKKRKMRKETLVFLLLAVVGILLATHLSAQTQDRPGGLFGKQTEEAQKGLMDRTGYFAYSDITGQGFGATNGEITGQTFGQNTPLGSGLLVLLAAGAGYSVFKSRKKQNRKEN